MRLGPQHSLHGSGTRGGSPSTAERLQVDLSHNSLRALPDEIGMCHSLQARLPPRLHAAGGRGACGSRVLHATRAPHYRPASLRTLGYSERTRGAHARTERCVGLHAPVTLCARRLRRLLLQRLNVGCNKLTSLPDTLAGLGRWLAAVPTRCTALQTWCTMLQTVVYCVATWCAMVQIGVQWRNMMLHVMRAWWCAHGWLWVHAWQMHDEPELNKRVCDHHLYIGSEG